MGILDCGDEESLWGVDDKGRCPLHDACWRIVPDLEVVSLILGRNKSLLFLLDERGASPLDYIHEENWNLWKKYIELNINLLWPDRHPVDISGSVLPVRDHYDELIAEENSEGNPPQAAAPMDLKPASLTLSLESVMSTIGTSIPSLGCELGNMFTPIPVSPDRMTDC